MLWEEWAQANFSKSSTYPQSQALIYGEFRAHKDSGLLGIGGSGAGNPLRSLSDTPTPALWISGYTLSAQEDLERRLECFWEGKIRNWMKILPLLIIAASPALAVEHWEGEGKGVAYCGEQEIRPWAEWEGTIDENGIITGTWWDTVSGDTGTFEGYRDPNTGAATGTWKNDENLYGGTWEGTFYEKDESGKWSRVRGTWVATWARARCRGVMGASGEFWGWRKRRP